MYHVKRQRQKIDKTATAKMAILRVLSWNKNFKIPNKNPPGRPPSKFMKSQDIKNRGTYGRFCMKSCNKNLRNSEIK